MKDDFCLFIRGKVNQQAKNNKKNMNSVFSESQYFFCWLSNTYLTFYQKNYESTINQKANIKANNPIHKY